MANNDKFLSMLGIAKRAKLISEGHDACVAAVLKGRAKMCLVTGDASERLTREFKTLADSAKPQIPFQSIPYTMDDIYKALSYRSAVMTVNDGGIAEKLAHLSKIQNGEENL